MKRHSGAGDKLKGRKRSTPKGGNAPKAERNRGASVISQGTVVARLTHERDEALLRETANSEILRLISKSPDDLELVFRTILENATRICNANFGTLYRFDGENIYPVAQFNTPAALLEAQTRRGQFPPTRGTAIGQCMRTKQVIHIADSAAEPIRGLAAKLGGARSLVAVPMLKDDALIGGILIYRQEVRPFTDKQIELVKNFAAQAVIAIENTRLVNELKQSLEQQTATADVLRVISSSQGQLQPVFEALLANAIRLCEAKFGVLYRYDGHLFHPDALVGVPQPLVEFHQRRGAFETVPGTPLHRLWQTRDVVHTADDAAGEPPSVSARLGGARSHLAVPMFKGDALVGSVIIYRQEVRLFTGKQIELVKNFAAQAVIAIENTRLLHELKQSLEQQTATADVLRVISSSPGDLEPVFQTMLENATRICEAKFGFLWLAERDGFRAVAFHNVPPALAAARRHDQIIHFGPETPFGRLTETRQLVHVADIRSEPAYVEGFRPMRELADIGGGRTLLMVPMLKENELVGAFAIYRQEVRPFTDKHIALAQNFAAQAVIAIENTRLLNELRQSLEQQTATADVLRVISSSPGDLKPVFQALLENATRLCEANFGNLFLREGNGFRTVAIHSPPSPYTEWYERHPFVEPTKEYPHSTLARLLEMKKLLHVADLRLDRGYLEGYPPIVALVDGAGARTDLLVPMFKEDQLIGVIVIYRTEVRPFTDKQIALVESFAAQAVIAIENTRLLNELKQSLEQQTATADVLRVISSSPGDLKPVFDAILENATRICEAKFGYLQLPENGTFRMAAMHNAPPAFAHAIAQREPSFRPGPLSMLARVVATKQLVHVADLSEHPAYKQGDPGAVRTVELAGARSVIVVPMLKEQELIGAIYIYRQEVRPFTDKQIALVQNFAAQAVIAIENARLLNELRERTEEVVKLNQQLEQRVTDQVGEIERMGRLRRFLPPQVADLIVASGTEKQLESHRREITALFCDLRGFTGFSESSDPEDVMALLRDYHAAIGEIIIKYSGTLERFAGDGVMVIFNDPVPVENPALQAVLMALDMRTAIGEMIGKWRDLGHDLGFGIGIAHGFATLGTIGFEGRFDYAAIGTVSNVASRLCDEAKPGQILISPRVRLAVDKAVTVEPVGDFELKGIRRPMAAYNVLSAVEAKQRN
jgi:GAF domain-containing protein